jgi:hypothetical protein
MGGVNTVLDTPARGATRLSNPLGRSIGVDLSSGPRYGPRTAGSHAEPHRLPRLGVIDGAKVPRTGESINFNAGLRERGGVRRAHV